VSSASEAVRVPPDRAEAEFAAGNLPGLLRDQQVELERQRGEIRRRIRSTAFNAASRRAPSLSYNLSSCVSSA
jgi:hypothetical protein